MRKIARLLLVWLMLLAIPFQGIASAAMLSCAHAGMAVQAAAPAPAAMPSEGHCHESAAPAPAAAHHAGDAGDADQHGAQHDHDGRCSACAACCMGAAMAPAPAIAPAPPSAPQLAVPAASGRLLTVDLDLPERPPRPSLA